MKNEEMMTINISRLKVLDVKLAIQEIIFDFEFISNFGNIFQ